MNIAFRQWLIGLVEAFFVGGTSSVSAAVIDPATFDIYHKGFWKLALASATVKMLLYINSTLSSNKRVEQALYTPPPKPKDDETKTG